MIERIEEIKGIGLMHDANGKPFKWQRATLIYADNGRGKSTLAAILRSLRVGDQSIITTRSTLDGTHAASVIVQFEHGHKVMFKAGSWSETRPELLIFDSDFVEKNVHSGGEVTTGHRKNLLDFALGEKAVAASAAQELATSEARKATDSTQRVVQQLTGFHQGSTLAEFESRAKLEDVDAQILDIEKRIIAANSSSAILRRSSPTAVALPTLDLAGYFAVLGRTMENIEADAEAIVRSHIQLLGSNEAEGWLSHGRAFDNGDTCPYCAQATNDVDLVRAYRTHFNAAYTALKKSVGDLGQVITASTAESVIDGFVQAVGIANSSINAWGDQISIPPLSVDESAVRDALKELRESLFGLARRKQTNPLEIVGSAADRLKAERLWGATIMTMQTANAAIANAKTDVETFRAKLASEDVQQLQRKLQELRFSKSRHSPQVVALIDALGAARAESSKCEEKKKAARDALDTLMKETLCRYERAINALLKKFGASFSIERMDANFRGHAPRSEYRLALRGKSIPLDGGAPSFASALSEGDKRTLAFAFFVASTLDDSKLSTKIVIVDDPMCSLDANRKQHTRTVLKQLFEKAKQLVVLAHDPYFIYDLHEDLNQKNSGGVSMSVFQLQHAPNDYTDFGAFDVHLACESAYRRHHRLLVDYVKVGKGDPNHVSKSIRPLLEGYLHRRFPGLIPRDLMFGQTVAYIRDADSSSPVAFAKGLVDELSEINAYAGQFHHDTNPGNADSVTVVPSELKTFAERSLLAIHKGSP